MDLADTPALEGGSPVRDRMLPYGRQSVNAKDIEAVVAVLQGDWLTQGPTIPSFEQAFAARLGAQHAVAFSSGTAALHAACHAAGLGTGDEAIVPAITFAATANAVLYVGAKPVFVDVDPRTGLLDPADLSRVISERTKAILPMHYGGLPADMEPIRDMARDRGLIVIEDACHALGAFWRDVPAGRIGEMGVFSFHPIKHLTTGEGGMVVTDDPALAGRLRQFGSHGIVRPEDAGQGGWHYEMRDLGYNYRLTDLQAALGLSQLARLNDFLDARRAHAAAYDAAFEDVSGVRTPPRLAGREHAYHLYPLLFDLDRLRCDKQTLFAALRAEGIGVQVHYIPVPRHPYYRSLGYDPADTLGAEAFFEREISVPMFVDLTPADRGDVVAAVRKVVTAYGR
jgi:perosamine synthetase